MQPRQVPLSDRSRARAGWSAAIGALALLVALGPTTQAQPAEVHTYARPGRPLMTLYVLGTVTNPGIWQVEREASLVEVLALINPNTATGDRNEGRDEHILKIYRGDTPPVEAAPSAGPTTAGASAGPDPARDGSRTLVFEAKIHDVLSGGRQPPHLRHGDVLMVEVTTHKPWLTLQTVTTTVGAVSAFVLLLLRIGDL